MIRFWSANRWIVCRESRLCNHSSGSDLDQQHLPKSRYTASRALAISSKARTSPFRPAVPPLHSCQRRTITSQYFGSSSTAAPAGRLLARDQGGARAAERVQHDVPALARVPDRPLDQRHRLHGRMQIVPRRLVDKPDVALVPRPAPVPIVPRRPAVQNRLILPLIVGAAERERVLRPDHERATTCRRPR